MAPLVGKLLRRIFTVYSNKQESIVFETEIGVKYKNTRFNSDRFNDFIIGELDLEAANATFSDLILPPDFLRNPYSSCGLSITKSPHYRLIEEIEAGVLNSNSEYLKRCRKGILDTRSSFEPNIDFLLRRFNNTKEKIIRDGWIEISVLKRKINGCLKFVIVDGKHRAALVSYLNKSEVLRLKIVSNEFVKEPFFRQTYSFILQLNPKEYSINQEIIQAMVDEHYT